MDVSTLLNRTYDPKFTTYRGDGMGRDTYITCGNGGLIADSGLPNHSPFTGFQASGGLDKFYTNQGCHQVRHSSHKDAVAFRYFGDGSGRDSYVIGDNGGLIPKYVSKGAQKEFLNSLRQPEAPRYVGSIAQ